MLHPLLARTWDCLIGRKAHQSPALRRRASLGITHLEDRITPTGPTFDYGFSDGGLGSIVTVIGANGQSVTAVADRLAPNGITALATVTAPDPILGVGQGYWSVEVQVANGFRATSVLAPVWNLDGSVYNAQTFTAVVEPDILARDAMLCGPVLPGLASDPAVGNDNSQMADERISQSGVEYHTGRATHREVDLVAAGLSGPFGQSREWAGGTGRDFGQRFGNGWANPNLPTSRVIGQGLKRVINTSGVATTFTAGNGVWVPTLDGQSQLVVNAAAGEVTLTDEAGTRTTFHDAAPGITPPERVGQFKQSIDAAGVTTQVVAWTTTGAPAEVRRSSGNTIESWIYAYGSTPVNANLTLSILFRRSLNGGTTWQSVQSAEYGYYGRDNSNGNQNDLRSVVIRTGDLTGPVVKSSYYRYFKPFDPNGFQNQLKAVVSDTAFDRLAAAYGVTIATADTLTDAQLAEYATKVYQYDSAGRVKSVVVQGDGCSACAGGRGTYTFAYGRNPNRPGYYPDGSQAGEQNVWHGVALETLPDGNTNRVYTNISGQAMLRVYTEVATGQQWETFSEFDGQGRVRRVADPVAVTGWSEQYNDLLNGVNGNYQFLSDTSGAVVEYLYGKTTTASATVAGDVTGYLRGTQVRQGEFAPLASPLSAQTYFSRTGAGTTIYPIATTTRYPNDRTAAPLFQDDFSGPALNAGWTLAGTGTWTQAGGVLSQTDTNGVAAVFKQAHATGQTWDPTQEIVASIRVDSWAVAPTGPWAAAGVGVRGDAASGLGYSLVFREGGFIRFQDNFRNLGPQVAFNWSVNTWYRMRVRIEDNVLYGKVWAASQAEPSMWMLSLDVAAAGWSVLPTGNPHLFGGMSWGPGEAMTASFDDVAVTNIARPTGETTTYAYTWSGTNPLLATSVTTTLPVVSAAQNGPGTADQSLTVFNAVGQPIWVRDQAGFLHYTAYDLATGAVVKTIVDVNATLTADFVGLPVGWTTPAGGGRHLTTVMVVDALGRTIRTTDPVGNIDHFTYDDATESAKTYAGWTGTTTTGPVLLVRRDRVGGSVTVNSQVLRYTYVETLTYAPTTIPVDDTGRPTGAEAVTNIQSLVRDYYNQSGQWVWRDEYFNLTGLTYLDVNGKPVFALGTEGVHFLRTRFDFDKQGRPNRVQSPDGTITRTVFDGQGRTVSTWRGNNDTPTTGFWSPANPAGMIQTAAFEYDNGTAGDGNLTKLILKPGGGAADRVTEMSYDWRNRLVVTKQGVEVTENEAVNRPVTYFDLDNLGRVTRTRVYDGDTVALADADGNGVPDAPLASRLRSHSETAYDSQGRVYRTTTTGVNQSTGAVSAMQWVTDAWYDRRGLVVKTRAPGGLVQKTAYDGVGRVTTASTSDGGGDTTWADAATLTGDIVFAQAEYTYDANSNVIRTVTKDRVDGQTGTGALGTPTTGVLARVTYSGAYFDRVDRVTATVDVGTNGGTAWTRPATVPARSDTALVTSYLYDTAGRLQDVTDPMAFVDRTTYDTLGRVVTSVKGQGSTVAQTTAYAYDSGGRLLSLTAPGGAVTRYGYDTFGRNSSVTRAFGTAIAQTVTTGFDNLDGVVTVVAPTGPAAAATTVTTRTDYDTVGRAVATTEAVNTPLQRTTTRVYDALGRTTSLTRPGSQTTSFAFDDTLMRRSTVDANGFTWLAAFDLAGNQTSSTDPLGHATTTAYDLRNRPTSTTDATNATTLFRYTVTGDRDTVTDARGNVTQTVKDRFGRTASTIDPFGKSTVFAYDRDDRLVSATDRLGRRIQYTYNAVDQLTSERWFPAGSTTALQTQNFTYDAAGNRTGASDPDGSYTLTYDALNRPLTVAAPFGVAFTFSYDAAGNRSGVTDNKGGTQASTYDVLGRLATRSLDTAGADTRVDYAYTVRDQVYTASRFSNVAGTVAAGQTMYMYDPVDRPTAITHRKADNSAIAAYSYAYDSVGRPTSQSENSTTKTFAYNARNEVTGDGATAYTYDPAGNRTMAGYTTSSVANRLLSDGTWTYTYDDEGQMTKKSRGASAETWTYGYDHRGQMVWAEQRATDGGTLQGRVEYSYDAFSGRIRRVQRNGSLAVTSDERYVLDGWDTAKERPVGTENFDAVMDLNSSNAVTTRRLFGAGADEVAARVAGSATGWYLADRQGSVRVVADNAGVALGSREYSAFGAITVTSGTGLDRYAYTGREWDAALGLQYTRARMYDPATGRFTSEDPLGLSAGDVNVHRYVGNAVTMYTDPSGLFWNILAGGAIGVLANGISNSINGRGFFDNWVQAAAAGAIGGGLGGSLFSSARAAGLGTLRAATSSATASGIIGYFSFQTLTNQPVTPEGVITAAVLSAALGAGLAKCQIKLDKYIDGLVPNVAKLPRGFHEARPVAPTPTQPIYNNTGDISKILESGRVWGQTEGSVYGMNVPNAPKWQSMAKSNVDDPGRLVFTGKAAALFSRHRIEGPYSLMKRLLGQYKSGFGDIVFNPANATTRTLPSGRLEVTISEATLGSHQGQSEAMALARLWGRRLGIDTPITAAVAYLGYHVGDFVYIYLSGK